MKAKHIVKADKEFRTWIRSNPEGYVLNAYTKPTERYLILHTARCTEWETDSTLTEGTYSKIVADTEESLREWMVDRGFDRNKSLVNGKGCRCLRFQGARARTMLLTGAEASTVDLAAQSLDAFKLLETDTRELALCAVRLRRGQASFRESLRKVHGDRCMITGCSVLDVIEAAHIKPFRGAADHHVQNGLLLRADIHTLFDLNLIGIDPESLTIVLVERLQNSEYGTLAGVRLQIRDVAPISQDALQLRWREFQSDAMCA